MKYYLTSVRYGIERLFENINCDKPMQDGPMYNAFERDIAVLNMFFGDSTVFGKSFGFFLSLVLSSLMFGSIAQNDSLVKNSHTYSFEFMLRSPSFPRDPQNTRGRKRWRVSSSSPTLAAFADSVLVSALSLPSRSFTGLQSGFLPVSEEPVRQLHQNQYKEQQVNNII